MENGRKVLKDEGPSVLRTSKKLSEIYASGGGNRIQRQACYHDDCLFYFVHGTIVLNQLEHHINIY